MRERYLERFDRIWIDCLNGDKYKTGKLTPEGEPDPSIFSTEFNREGIQVGTAISLLARARNQGYEQSRLPRPVGEGKRAQLLEEAERSQCRNTESCSPRSNSGCHFGRARSRMVTCRGLLLPELFPVFISGREDEP